MEQQQNDTDRGKREVPEEKPVAVSLCPPHISHELDWDRTPSSAMTGQRLTT